MSRMDACALSSITLAVLLLTVSACGASSPATPTRARSGARTKASTARPEPASAPSPSPPASTVHVVQAHVGRSQPVSQVLKSIRDARDPKLPAIVATVNGVPVRATAVAQAEVVLAISRPNPPPAGHAREEAALQLVIRNTLLADAAMRLGDAPSRAEAGRQLAAMGVKHPTVQRIAEEQRGLARLRLERQVEGRGTPAYQTARLNAYVRKLTAKATIIKAPGF